MTPDLLACITVVTAIVALAALAFGAAILEQRAALHRTGPTDAARRNGEAFVRRMRRICR